MQGFAIKTFGFPPKFFILESISPKALETYKIKNNLLIIYQDIFYMVNQLYLLSI